MGGVRSPALSEAETWVSPELLTEYRQVPIELEAADKITREQTTARLFWIPMIVSLLRRLESRAYR